MDADDYFLGGDSRWQGVVKDHYDNVYCSYFARKRFRPGGGFLMLPDTERLEDAQKGLRQLDFVGANWVLGQLEEMIGAATGRKMSFSNRSDNVCPFSPSQSRW